MCPPDAAHRLRVLVLDRDAHVDIPLTLFANRSRQHLSSGSARGYLLALLPFIAEMARARRSGDASCGWELEPRAVRRLVAGYLNDRYACVVRQHRVGFQIVARTAGTRSKEDVDSDFTRLQPILHPLSDDGGVIWALSHGDAGLEERRQNSTSCGPVLSNTSRSPTRK